MTTEGGCPTCSSEVDASDAKNSNDANVPWHFWLVVVALVGYLGWRLIEAVIWLVGQL